MEKNTVDTFRKRLVLDERTGCLLYPAPNKTGYGRFSYGGKVHQAHRFAYELANGPINRSLVLDHVCRMPSCCNVDHLEPVTQRTNVVRGISPPALHAIKTHCAHGHPYNKDNTILVQRKGNAKRVCRACKNASERLRRSGTPNPYREQAPA